jgi:hypothetical protein
MRKAVAAEPLILHGKGVCFVSLFMVAFRIGLGRIPQRNKDALLETPVTN